MQLLPERFLFGLIQKMPESNYIKTPPKNRLAGWWPHFALIKGLDERTFLFDSHKSCSLCFQKKSKSGRPQKDFSYFGAKTEEALLVQ